MARTLASLLVRLEGDPSRLIKAYKQAQASTAQFAEYADQLGRGIAAIGTVAIAAGGKLLSMAGDAEQTRVSFEVFTKSAESARKLLADLNRDSIPSPFTPETYQAAAKTLLGFGESLGNVRNSLRNLGEAAAATGQKDLSGLSLVYGQIIAQQRAFTQDLNQFVNQGIPIFDLLADTMQRPAGEMKKLAAEGKITSDVIQKAFADAAAEGGRFEGAMLKQSETLNGLLSILQGNLNVQLRTLGEKLLPGAKIAVQEANKQLSLFSKEIERMAADGTLDDISAGFTAIASSMGVFVRNINASLGPLRGLINLLRGDLKQAAEDFLDPFENLKNIPGDLDKLNEKFEETKRILAGERIGQRGRLGFLANFGKEIEEITKPSGGGGADKAAEDLKKLEKALSQLNRGFASGPLRGLSGGPLEYFTKGIDDAVISTDEFLKKVGQFKGLDAIASQASPQEARALLGDTLTPGLAEAGTPIETLIEMENRLASARQLAADFGLTFGSAFGQIPGLLSQAAEGAKSFGEVWKNVGKGLKEVFKQLIKDLIAVLIKTALIRGLTALLGDPTGGFGKSFLDALGGGGGGLGSAALSGLAGSGGFDARRIELYSNISGNDLYLSNQRTGQLYNRTGG